MPAINTTFTAEQIAAVLGDVHVQLGLAIVLAINEEGPDATAQPIRLRNKQREVAYKIAGKLTDWATDMDYGIKLGDMILADADVWFDGDELPGSDRVDAMTAQIAALIGQTDMPTEAEFLETV